MKKRWKLVIAGLVVVGALGYLGYRGYVSSAAYYLEVGEFLTQRVSLVNQNVRLAGIVSPGSIVQNGRNLRFSVTDGESNVPVVYEGVVPDTFKAGGEIVVEGKLDEAGAFIASVLMPKCPSKYIPE